MSTKTLLVLGLVGAALYMFLKTRGATGGTKAKAGVAAGSRGNEAWVGAAAGTAQKLAGGVIDWIFGGGSSTTPAVPDNDININAD